MEFNDGSQYRMVTDPAAQLRERELFGVRVASAHNGVPYVDTAFARHRQALGSMPGLLLYQYVYGNAGTPEAQADFFVAALGGGLRDNEMIMLDIEAEGGIADPVAFAQRWLGRVEFQLRCKSWVYVPKALSVQLSRAVTGDRIIMAPRYSGNAARGAAPPWSYDVHQYTDRGYFPGCTQTGDVSYTTLTVAEMLQRCNPSTGDPSMVASQNGWRANDRSLIESFPVPGGSLLLRRGPAGQCLALVATRYHQTVEPLLWPGCWAYAERLIRGSETVTSNHASGTAEDLCAPLHPLGTDPRSNFSAAKLSAIRTLVNACKLNGKQLIRWGGDYFGRKDGMHWEVNDNVTEAELAKLVPILQRLVSAPAAQGGNTGGIKWGPVVNAAPGSRTIGVGSQGPNDVEYVQRWHGLVADGAFGNATAAAVKTTQTRNGLLADGIVGPATWKVILGH